MKVKRQRQTRRHLRFFRTTYGFHEPFKVLCDGNFVHHVTALKISPIPQSLPKLLGAPTKAYTTKCVVKELRQLGEGFQESAIAARQLLLHKCEHDPALPPSECLTSAVAGGNTQHFFVATQDASLRAQLLQLPGTALIHTRSTALVLDPPSELQLSFAQQQGEASQHLPRHEREALQARAKMKAAARDQSGKVTSEGGVAVVKGHNGLFEAVEGEGSGGEGGGERARVHWRKGYGEGKGGEEEEGGQDPKALLRKRRLQQMIKDAPKFRRNRPRGPNPLSCRKKKVLDATHNTRSEAEGDKKPKRARRKSKKSSAEQS